MLGLERIATSFSTSHYPLLRFAVHTIRLRGYTAATARELTWPCWRSVLKDPAELAITYLHIRGALPPSASLLSLGFQFVLFSSGFVVRKQKQQHPRWHHTGEGLGPKARMPI